MSYDAILDLTRLRAANPATRTDTADICATRLYPTATEEEINAFEAQVGFPLPRLLVAAFTRISNGGFGPGYGLWGVAGGHGDDESRTLAELYRFYSSFELRNNKPWIPGILPLCDWGCSIVSCVDCTVLPGTMVTFDGDALFRCDYNFSEWLSRWANGRDLWREMFAFQQRSFVDPFTKTTKTIEAPCRTLGTEL